MKVCLKKARGKCSGNPAGREAMGVVCKDVRASPPHREWQGSREEVPELREHVPKPQVYQGTEPEGT